MLHDKDKLNYNTRCKRQIKIIKRNSTIKEKQKRGEIVVNEKTVVCW